MEPLRQTLTALHLWEEKARLFVLSATCMKPHSRVGIASRRLSTSAVGEKIGRYQPFFRKAMSKMFVLGKRHILLFYAEDKNRMCISI